MYTCDDCCCAPATGIAATATERQAMANSEYPMRSALRNLAAVAAFVFLSVHPRTDAYYMKPSGDVT